MSKRDDPQLRVRIPERLKTELENCARDNKRTLTAEIVDRLETTLDQDGYWLTDSLGYKRFIEEYGSLQEENISLQELNSAQKRMLIQKSSSHKAELLKAIETIRKFIDGELE